MLPAMDTEITTRNILARSSCAGCDFKERGNLQSVDVR